jgi:hypothetical protein
MGRIGKECETGAIRDDGINLRCHNDRQQAHIVEHSIRNDVVDVVWVVEVQRAGAASLRFMGNAAPALLENFYASP